MTKYKIYYWIYAFLNKQYGSSVLFKRDPLHKRFSVNKHSFSISLDNENVKKLNEIYSFLEKKLLSCNYLKYNDTSLLKKYLQSKKQFIISLNKCNSNKIVVSIYSYPF